MAFSKQQITVPVDITSTLLLGSNQKRRGIIISAPLTNRFTISFTPIAVLDQGITLYPGANPFVLEAAMFG